MGLEMLFRVGIRFETGRQKLKKPENVENVIFSGERARSGLFKPLF